MSDIDIYRRLRALEDEIERLRKADVSGRVIARYTTNAGLSLANNTLTIIDFEDVSIDTDDAVTVGAAWVFTSPRPGYYQVRAGILLGGSSGWANAESGRLDLFKNGALYSYLDYKDNYSGGATQFMRLQGGDIVYLASGDTCQIRAVQVSGAAIALDATTEYNYVSIGLAG